MVEFERLWEYTITGAAADIPGAYEGQILVPFPIESALSGVMKNLQPFQRLWYHKTFKLPPARKGQHILLHFGSVDWQASVYLNGTKLIKAFS